MITFKKRFQLRPRRPEYTIKDGVVLESELIKNRFFDSKQIKNLKESVEWRSVPLFNMNYPINLYILSKHPEIISKEDYKKFLRQSLERIKLGVLKAEENVKGDGHNYLEITNNYAGKSIWFSEERVVKEGDDKYKKISEYAEKFVKDLFDQNSSKYVGITKDEYQLSNEILEYIEKLINNIEIASKNKDVFKIKYLVASIFLTFIISLIVSWFVKINAFIIFIVVQIVTFFQAFIGGWIDKKIKKR